MFVVGTKNNGEIKRSFVNAFCDNLYDSILHQRLYSLNTLFFVIVFFVIYCTCKVLIETFSPIGVNRCHENVRTSLGAHHALVVECM